MDKLLINMLSQADSVEGQGVGSAYLEQVALVKQSPKLEIKINSKEKSDLIHIHSINFSYFGKMKKRGTPVVCYVHFLPETLKGSIKMNKLFTKVFHSYVVRFYKRATHLVVVNPIFTKKLVELGIKEKNISYIPNYVDQSGFFPIEDKASLKEKLGFEKDDFVVVSVGQIQTRKGVLDFIDVAKKLPHIKFIWAGGFSFKGITDGYKELKEATENAPSNIKFLGIIPRTEMNSIYNASDVFFMPSYNELFPMSILESMRLHLPLVLRDLDLYEPIFWDKYNKGTNNESFASIIEKLRVDKEYYKASQNDTAYLKDYYSKESILKYWEDLYQRVYLENIQTKK